MYINTFKSQKSEKNCMWPQYSSKFESDNIFFMTMSTENVPKCHNRGSHQVLVSPI